MKKLIVAGLLSVFAGAAVAQGAQSRSVDELLKLVEQGLARDAAEHRQRLREFSAEKAKQEQILRDRQKELERLERESAAKEKTYQANETALAEEQARLNERLGSLKDLFGVLQQTAGDFRGVVAGSVISAEYPQREVFLNDLIAKAGSSSKLPKIEEIERLWFEMQREMTAAGKTVRFTAPVVQPGGELVDESVVRVGSFNVVGSDGYIVYEAETAQLKELVRQPASRYTGSATDFAAASGGEARDLWMDPSRGSILGLLIQSPSIDEKVQQGGVVGYIIIALGVFALMLAAERLLTLSLVSSKVQRQMKQPEPKEDNPLGRVMATYSKWQRVDTETLELRLAEAIQQEVPRIQRFLPLLKIIAVVAPLLGLLGTVTGMINTFQAITLFGTGDPKLMAGGISQALVTTVLGLCVAVPTVLLHTVVAGRAKRLGGLIQERATGIMAEHAEQRASGHAA